MRARIFIGTGIGNIVKTTPLIQAVHSMGYEIELVNNPTSKAGLEVLEGWPLVERQLYFKETSEYSEADVEIFTPWAQLPPVRPYNNPEHHIGIDKNKIDWRTENEEEVNMRLARQLGYEDEMPWPYVECPEERLDVPYKSYCVIVPGCFPNQLSSMKRWEYWGELVPMLDRPVIILGAPNDWMPFVWPPSGGEFLSFIGSTNIKEAFQIIRHADFFIGHDAGLTHAAAALRTKTFIIYGYTVIKRSQPRGSTVITKGKHCQPCQFASQFSCGGKVCLDELSAKKAHETILCRLAN